jgi:hypothetical protein
MSLVKIFLNKYRDITIDSFVELWVQECRYSVYPPDPFEKAIVLR